MKLEGAFSILKSLRTKRSLINGAMFSLFSFINKGFSFVLLMILANYITPTEYGYLSLWGTVVMVIGYFISMSSDGYMEVSYFQEGESGITKTFSCVLCTTLITGLIFAILLFTVGDFISEKLDLPLYSLYIALLISFFTIFTNMNLNLFRIKEKVKFYGIFSCSNALLNFIISIVLLKYLLMGWPGRVYAQLFCFCLFGIIGIAIFVRRKHLKLPDVAHWKKMLIWGVPLIPHLATDFIRQGCDRYIINGFHSIEQVGLFSFALNLATIITMVGIGFNQSNSVDIYKILGDKSLDNKTKNIRLKKQRNIIRWVYVVTAFSVMIICYFAVPIIFPTYSLAKGYVPLLSIYALFLCFYFLYTNYLFYYSKTKMIMFVTVGSSLIHLALSYTLTRYSLYFTCLVYCISQFIVFIVIRQLAVRELKKQLA